MSTIGDLCVTSSVSSDDKLPIWSNANGVTRALPISVLDGRYLTADEIALLAASTTVETFVSGTDFTPGVSTALVLENQYYSSVNIEVFFDSAYQGPDQYSLAGYGLTFNTPIPVGVQNVYVRGGAARLIGAPSDGTVTDAKVATGSKLYNRINDTVSVKDCGARGDGISNDTVAFVTSFTKGSVILVPAGTYVLDQITIPASVKVFAALGAVTLLPSANVPSGATIAGFSLQAPSATYPNLTCLSLALCQATTVVGNTLSGAGYVGISSALGTNNKIISNRITDWLGSGIVISGSSFSVVDLGTETSGNICVGNGPSSIAHGISHQFALDFDCHDNKCQAAGTFGIAAYQCLGGSIHDNLCYNTTHEGINTEDSSNTEIRNNTCRWDSGGGPGTDFGISVFGNASHCSFIDVTGNKVINSASSGICLAGSASFGVQNSTVQGNSVINCNAKKAGVAGGTDNLAGILMSGTFVQANSIKTNFVYDSISALTYAIAEHNFGVGAPTSNEITSNRIFTTTSFTGAPIQRTNTFTTLMGNTPDLAGLQAYIPVVTSSVGAITSYTASGGYVQFGRTVFWIAQVAITNNGTGSGQLNVSGPFAGVNSTIGAGLVSGQNVSTGKAISGAIPSNGSSAVISNYDGTYPVVSGNTITVFGIEMIA
jgi:parallel beta-helix repeat protein